MSRSTEVKVKQDDQNPVEIEVLAQAIVSVSTSMRRLLQSGMNRKAIVVLVAYDTKLGYGQINDVINSLESLAQTYTAK